MSSVLPGLRLEHRQITLGEVLNASTHGTTIRPEHGIDEPVALPGPVLDFLEGQVKHRPRQAAEREDQYAQSGIRAS